MLTKAERFHDARVDRRSLRARMPYNRAVRRVISKGHKELFKAVREDRRFARIELARALDRAGYHWSACIFSEGFAVFHPRQWAQHELIPFDAFQLSGAHPAESDPSKIACYPTLADAKRGREVVLTPGRFFAAVYPNESPAFVQKRAEAYAMKAAPATMHYAEGADEWVRVYKHQRGFSSCMGGEMEMCDDLHPVRFYVHPDNDLALVYLTHNGKPDGETVARSVVNTKTKNYVRVYGDGRLLGLLESAGFEGNAYAALNGQKCAAVSRNGDLVAPYLDAVGRAEWDGVADFCIITESGNYECDSTSGVAGRAYHPECEECGDVMDEDDSTYSEYHEITICTHCADAHFIYAIVSARGRESLVRDDETVTVGNRTFVNDCEVLEAFNCVQDNDGDWHDLEDCIYLESTGSYEPAGNCTRLDVPNGEDDYALDCDTKTVILNGETLVVYCDYQGPTDESIRAEKSAKAYASALAIRQRELARRRAA